MSWMDSWSRPSKWQATSPPLYLLPGGEATPYCRSCGRVISHRKSHNKEATNTPAKYCSSRCRNQKPGKLDRQIEDIFVKSLNGEEDSLDTEGGAAGVRPKEKASKKKKGESRILVSCDAVEKSVFGDHFDPEKVYGRRRNRARRGAPDDEEWKSVDMLSDEERATASDASTSDTPIAPEASAAGEAENAEAITTDGDVMARLAVRSGTRIRPAQGVSEVNGSVGGEKGWAERVDETDEMLERRRQGQKRAHEREMVRCAARRGVAFGFVVKQAGGDQTEARRKCEAVMHGKVVESSFAKGDWSVRWRE
ncbi:hypothetical protein BFW01_g1424 [Lasiodiplodia theobromae]|uniref:Uncharacterized protein n=1 Tax=Lasiodiplodia theobromae TaxID=45133 RepID=A0A8H7MCM8_9PEZI|nr:uncharacterized protein LTHEOB_2011 [Lasiodiplodia theobromae]KAF4536250.1 hypothetical protein LTHEOB_2011 [Lasiodiplodia theobromae]KAF9630862.1 hypothetical protein BFW01_g1424 [Lasiodiplodia theobromae]